MRERMMKFERDRANNKNRSGRVRKHQATIDGLHKEYGYAYSDRWVDGTCIWYRCAPRKITPVASVRRRR